MNVLDFLKGNRTYVIIGAFGVLAVLMLFFGVAIPEYVFAMLAAVGLGFLRAGIAEVSGNKGWKTYVAVIATVAIAILRAAGVALPAETIYAILGAIGVVGVRNAVAKIS